MEAGVGSGSDPDELPTMVIPSQPATARDDPARGMARPPAGGPRRATLITGLIGGVVATGILGLAALAWFQRPGDGNGGAPLPGAAPLPRAGKAETGGTRGAIEATAEPPRPDGRPAGEAGTAAGVLDATKPTGAPEATTAPVSTPRLQLLIPAYFYPSGAGMKAWQHLMEDSTKVPIVASRQSQ